MRSGSRCSPFTPFNAFHGRRYRRLRALSFLLKADPWHAMTGAKAPRPRPGHRSALPHLFRSARRRPAPVRHRPCKAPVGSLAVNALAVSRSGLVVSQPVPGCRSPLASARDPPGPAPPGGSRSAAPRQHPGTAPSPRPCGLPAGPGLEPPLAPARASCRPPMRSRRGRCPDVPSAVRQVPCRFPSYGCMRGEPPIHQQLFFKFFHEFFRLRPAWCFRT